MKRLAALFSAVVIAIILLLFTRMHPAITPSSTPAQAAVNFNPRPLTAAEQTKFLNLVCPHASGAAEGYAHRCASLPDYPAPLMGTQLAITLQSIIYGHLTNALQDEAYVTYAGSFEPHVTNYGGGILFTGGPGHWALKAWYPGGQASQCVVLNPTGEARFVCLTGGEGQGETTAILTLGTLPFPQGLPPSLLSANDLRATMTPNANCQGLQPGKNILLDITHLRPAPEGARVDLTYVPAATAQTACLENRLASAPVRVMPVTLHWQNGKLSVTPHLNFGAQP